MEVAFLAGASGARPQAAVHAAAGHFRPPQEAVSVKAAPTPAARGGHASAIAVGAVLGLAVADARGRAKARRRRRSAMRSAEEGAELIALAEKFINEESAFYSPPNPDSMADDFVFRGPTVGPLCKKDYLDTLGTFGVYKAFPDIKPNAFGFVVDPDNSRLVRFFVRHTGTNDGPFSFGYGIELPPTGKKAEGATEAFSILFDDENKVKMLTVGYVCNRFEGNTNGLGAALGLMNFLGLPIRPGLLYDFLTFLNNRVLKLKAKTCSAPEDVPAWWPHAERGAEGY